MTNSSTLDQRLETETVEKIDALGARMAKARAQVETVIFGQRNVVDQTLTTVLAGGHALLIGVPGLAKTRLVETLGIVLGLEDKRIQCTPDLMPADIIGAEILEESDDGKRHFRFVKGPVFAQILMADEINRASPRTQSALLQAMQERTVSVGGHTYELPSPFLVLATQNPLEQEGTYPLPEAQLDRFMFKLLVDYPTQDQENAILDLYAAGKDNRDLGTFGIEPVLNTETILEIQRRATEIIVEPSIINYITSIVSRTRGWHTIEVGASPRASVNLLIGSRVMAACQGRDFVVPDDVKELALPVLRHRIRLHPEAEIEGVNVDDVIREILESVEAPRQ